MNLEKIYAESGDMKPYIHILYGIAKATKGDILEIGVRKGQSTKTFLAALEGSERKLVSIDLAEPRTPIKSDRWEFIQGDSKKVWSKIAERTFSIIMIDGDHSRKGVYADWNNYTPLCEPYGFIILHDIGLENLPARGIPNGVKDLWEEKFKKYGGIELNFNKYGLGVLVAPRREG